MKCALSNSTSDQSQVKKTLEEIDNQRMITVGVNTSHYDTDTIYNCPLCSKPADLNIIHCDKCLEWVHFDCAGLTKSRVDNIPDIAPFTCRLCCDDLLYNASAMHMANNTEPDSSLAATPNTNSELPMIYPPSTSSSISSAVTHHNQLLFVPILVSNIYSQPQILICIHQLSQSSFLMILSVFKWTTSQLPLLHKTYQHLVVLLILTL